MKNLHYLLAALLVSLTLPNRADALNWPTCPSAAQISHSTVNGIVFSDTTNQPLDDAYNYVLGGTRININQQTWYVYVSLHATNNTEAFTKGQNALHAIIDNPYEQYEQNTYGCVYNTTINYSTQVVVTTSPFNFSGD
jgi:hypothetical protein